MAQRLSFPKKKLTFAADFGKSDAFDNVAVVIKAVGI